LRDSPQRNRSRGAPILTALQFAMVLTVAAIPLKVLVGLYPIGTGSFPTHISLVKKRKLFPGRMIREKART
jgi:hypothetical protein